MTQAFLIVVRILAVALFLFWGYRLWTGTQSWTSRILGSMFSALLIWQSTFGTWT
ncbi:hypothetical protein KKG90_01745 [Candidatus Bipolaricaulota bacterium]|nr:hypothetical protein [Candidatus Bipolaricaulota bacterium]